MRFIDIHAFIPKELQNPIQIYPVRHGKPLNRPKGCCSHYDLKIGEVRTFNASLININDEYVPFPGIGAITVEIDAINIPVCRLLLLRLHQAHDGIIPQLDLGTWEKGLS